VLTSVTLPLQRAQRQTYARDDAIPGSLLARRIDQIKAVNSSRAEAREIAPAVVDGVPLDHRDGKERGRDPLVVQLCARRAQMTI